jgi:pyruvate/2-oxoglutarate dehydrogenase complex dihydrolipoamide dehydrogenase (E3) component
MSSSTHQDIERFDLISLGSGEAGKYIAWKLAATGLRAVVIERQYLGGSCPNVACLPSKNVIFSAGAVHLASQAGSFGLPMTVTTEPVADIKAIIARKKTMVDGLVQMHEGIFEKTKVPLIWGDGKFVGPKVIEIVAPDGTKRLLTAETIIICTGSRAKVDDIAGLRDSNPMTHVDILNINEIPKHLVILGGGYVGLEFAQALRRLGAKVTVIERNPKILKNEDDDVVEALVQVLEAEGVEFSMSTTIKQVSGTSGTSVTLTGLKNGKPFEIQGSHILCAAGRLPNTDGIGAEKAGVDLTEAGFVAVNEQLQTSAEGVFAVGDCAGSPFFTHVGYDDFRIVRDYLLGKPASKTRKSSRLIPFTLFTSPELAHVGLREYEAKAKGIPYRLSKLPMAGFLRTRTMGGSEGFAKLLVADDDKILGFTVLGPNAGELLPVVQLAITKDLLYTDIAELILTHPTMGEGLVSLFSAIQAKS